MVYRLRARASSAHRRVKNYGTDKGRVRRIFFFSFDNRHEIYLFTNKLRRFPDVLPATAPASAAGGEEPRLSLWMVSFPPYSPSRLPLSKVSAIARDRARGREKRYI